MVNKNKTPQRVLFLFVNDKISLLYMTCFWDGILQSLKKTDIQNIIKRDTKPNNKEFIQWLQTMNTPMIDVVWNNEQLSTQEIKEHMETIKSYNINNINRGHDCGVCDSFLLLISQLFQVNIHHSYINHQIRYVNTKHCRKTLHFSSTSSHFRCI